MKIKVLNSCSTSRPIIQGWEAGQIIEVTEEQGRILLKSKNFIEAKEAEEVVKTKDEYVSNRKKK